MKATRTYKDLVVEFEAATMQDLWKVIASADEVFHDTRCAAVIDGKVLVSDKVVLNYRVNEDNPYYELVCVDRSKENMPLFGFIKRFGVHKKGGTLFPHRDTPDGHQKGLNGWSKYIKPQ